MVIRKPMLKRSGIIALIVGAILTLVNNGPQLFAEGTLPAKAVLNFLVPFVVSLTAQVIAGRDHVAQIQALKAAHAAELAEMRAAYAPDYKG